MSTVQIEQVMVVPTKLFHSCGLFQGFCSNTEKYLDTLLDPNNTQYLPRDKMESDSSFKQLIPYCVFQFQDKTGIQVFRYTRGKGQGESRLHSKSSVGIGGHVSTIDLADASPYQDGMQRELDEELVIETKYSQECVGLINDDSNEVGKVHLGIVHLLKVEQPTVFARELDIVDARFSPIDELMADIECFESWSQICLKALYGKPQN